MCDDLSRRNVIATGAALALAAPLSTLTTASASDAEDWPEFKPWLDRVLWLQEQWAQPELPWQEQRAKEELQEEVLDAMDPLEDAMLARPAMTERQLAMVLAIVMFHFDRPAGTLLFDAAALDKTVSCGLSELLTNLCRRAAVVLPEVPFTFPAEEG